MVPAVAAIQSAAEACTKMSFHYLTEDGSVAYFL